MQRRIGTRGSVRLFACAAQKEGNMYTTRLESDSIGSMMIPENVYYGVQSLRASRNFQITGQNMNTDFLRNLALIIRSRSLWQVTILRS